MGKILYTIMLLSLLAGFLFCIAGVQNSEADGFIYINADGSISPPTAPISTFDSITYTFANNIVGDSIIVQRDNIVLDGDGYTLWGGSGDGIYLYGDYVTKSGRINVTIRNANIVGFNLGIHLYYSLNCTVSQNNVANNAWGGIFLDNSSGSTVSNDEVTNNGNLGIGLYYSCGNAVFGNNATSNGDGVYLENSLSNTVSGNDITNNTRYGVELYSSSDNNNVTENEIANNNDNGIYLLDSSGNRLSGNNIINNLDGIVLDSSSYNTITGNNVTDDGWGIVLRNYSDNNTITENQVTANSNCGISLDYSSINTISQNNIADNYIGLDLYSSSSDTITGNSITSNDEGMHVAYSSGSTIYHNNFIDNYHAGYIDQVYSIGSVNMWNDSYPSGGNYWSDYTGIDYRSGPYQHDFGWDGIGDTPYVIDADNADNYPLMLPYGSTPPPPQQDAPETTCSYHFPCVC
jgi:parallel beta-helix repeat protein